MQKYKFSYTQGAAIGGHQDSVIREFRPICGRHHRPIRYTKPDRMFIKWGQNYKMPWSCLFEIAIVVFYIVFAISIQHTLVPFFQDFGDAIADYFLEGHVIQESLIDDTYGESRIYTRSDFLNVVNTTVSRFMSFATEFPCSYTLTESTNLVISIKDLNGVRKSYTVDHNNASSAIGIAADNVNDFTTFQLRMDFAIQPTTNRTISYYKVGVISKFDMYLNTGIILWKTLNDRSIVYQDISISKVFTQLSLTSCTIIIILCAICCVFEVIQLCQFYFVCKEKAKRERTPFFVVFRNKMDKWELIAFLMNVVSIVSISIYLKYGKDLSEAIPWPNFLVGVSCFFHCFIIIRYLQLIPSTLIVVRMLRGGIISISQFLVGCLPFFFGFAFVGVSLFGWYSPHYTSPRQAAKLMISSSYGDYLLDGYDEMAAGADKSKLIPSIFFSVWVFNSYVIWFYVVLATFHEALVKQVHIAREENEDLEENSDDPLPWLQYLADHQ